MLQMQKVSIIVPIYKVETYLPQCIDSIINQTYKNIELILVDDASPDNCGKICDDYASRDARIIVIHQENGGLSGARNAGVAIATGEYVMFVDGDDYLSENAVSIVVSAMESKQLDCLMFNVNLIDGDCKRLIGQQSFDDVCDGLAFLERMTNANVLWVMVWLYCYRRSILTEYALQFKTGIVGEDEHFTPRAVLFCKRVTYIDKPLYNYVKRPDSITTTSDTKKIIKRYENVISTLYELEHFYNEHIPRDKGKVLRELSANKYLRCAAILKHYKRLKKVDYEFLKRNIFTTKMKIKVAVFKVSYTLYAHLANIKMD